MWRLFGVRRLRERFFLLTRITGVSAMGREFGASANPAAWASGAAPGHRQGLL
jgi:hypothetical protein